jgi:adenosylcobyric acid synthase
MGETTYERNVETACTGLIKDAAILSVGRVLGTYIHGLFDDDDLRYKFLGYARQTCGLAPVDSRVFATAERQARIDRWADHLRRALDMTLIRKWAEI